MNSAVAPPSRLDIGLAALKIGESRSAWFPGRHFPSDVIVLRPMASGVLVRYRDLQEIMAERGLTKNHSTIDLLKNRTEDPVQGILGEVLLLLRDVDHVRATANTFRTLRINSIWIGRGGALSDG
jgi:hypothetical protein